MKKNIIRTLVVIWIISFFLPGHALSDSQEKVIRAKVGLIITTPQKVYKARAKDILKPGNLIQIYVYAEDESFIYVVYENDTEITFLHQLEKKTRKTSLILPSATLFYEVDQNDKIAYFTVIVSPEPIAQIQQPGETSIDRALWSGLKKDLTTKSRIGFGQKKTTPFPMAGNVRSINDKKNKAFIKDIPVYSGNGVIIKNYEFKIKK